MSEWLLLPGGGLLLALLIAFRLLLSLARRVNDHAERISRIEGRLDRHEH